MGVTDHQDLSKPSTEHDCRCNNKKIQVTVSSEPITIIIHSHFHDCISGQQEVDIQRSTTHPTPETRASTSNQPLTVNVEIYKSGEKPGAYNQENLTV